ncbi:50S ribosomal protein L11 methyltransferase [Mucilaginibacter jinjuensis]|uniref:Ribosomal protein L11 methyltransferase n=1 Tax=Mucilaginibacter jinjuensis TaxID=1176721 RepID=A0ABY7T329_9SPHI|nr:50S ribosomal protein L11 methyltransferase [Mucilaginibacter jinjuensis]WCT10844.1 50S ribosomal protein L11 methyltransferase [Mucilaginibacter jinjuensis]
MNYYELVFTLTDGEDYQQDLLIDALGGLGFDTFEETETGFKAYTPAESFDKYQVDEALSEYDDMFTFTYEVNLIPQKNWNEEWESNFQPMQVGEKVRVRATFHPTDPAYPYEIVIDPKMAFGTGHHETTTMMMAHILEADLAGKYVLDMGCGTGILAILASKVGASEVVAIDYDPLSYESTVENSKLNKADNILAVCGSKDVIPDAKFDTILANINRNILLDQMKRYGEVLKQEGEIYFSGFYESPDLDIIKEEAGKHGMNYIEHKKMKDWVAARFVKA